MNTWGHVRNPLLLAQLPFSQAHCTLALACMALTASWLAGSYEGHIMSYNSIVAAQSNELSSQETGATTPRARPLSRFAVVRRMCALLLAGCT